MGQRSSSNTSLPGPATAPTSTHSTLLSPIPLQSVSTSSTIASPTEPILTQFNAAWKFEGYKAFSAWMASDDDFFIIRRFENLNARTLLWMQDRIVQIENELNEIDQEVIQSDSSKKFINGSFRWDEEHMKKRHRLMGDLSTLLHHYNQFIEVYSKVRARPRADEHQITNVSNWLHRNAILGDESSFIKKTGDLISINHRTRPPLGRWLESSFDQLPCLSFFRAKTVQGVHQPSPVTLYTSNSRFDTFTNISIILGGLIMLLAPMWLLEFVNDDKKKLGIVTGSICVFIGLMSTGTVNRPFEVVAATAAYAAVLMVFMQIDGYGDGS